MTVFSDAMADILHDTSLRTAATFRGDTVYGHFTNRSVVIDGVRTKIIAFELVDADLDQAPAKGEMVVIDTVTYEITDTDPDYDSASTILELRKTT